MLDLKRIANEKELRELAVEMKMSAVKDKHHEDESHKAWKSQAEAVKACADPKLREYVQQDPCIQPIVYEKRIGVTLVLSCDMEIDGPSERWHLSMSKISMPPGRVPDPDARFFALAFMDDPKEIPTVSKIYTCIRDFVEEKI